MRLLPSALAGHSTGVPGAKVRHYMINTVWKFHSKLYLSQTLIKAVGQAL